MNASDVLRDIAALIAIPSISSVVPAHDMPNEPLVHHLAERFEALGFRCSVQPLPERPGKANLVATLGTGDGGLVLAGHTDTVPCDAGSWTSDPFRLDERGDRLYGLGASDMKSFFALAAAAAADLRKPARPLIVLATADEESSMAGARALAAMGQPRARYALIGEPTALRPVHQHKGILMERIIVEGRSGHSSNPSLGRNSLEGMHCVIGAIIEWREELMQRHTDSRFAVPVPTLNLGRIAGGDNPNRICARCELDIDLRCLPGMDITSLRAELRERASRPLTGSGLGIGFHALLEGVPPMSTDPGSAIVREAERLTGAPAGSVAFATEAPFLAELGAEVVVLGPGSIEQAHQPDEYLELRNVPGMIEILQKLIRRFCC